MTRTHIPIGIGIYGQAEAARLLRMTPSRLRRWVNGYTYWLHAPVAGQEKRKRPPVIRTELPIVEGVVALSFLELMELRVVKAIVDKGLSLQHVRSAARLAASRFDTRHPFASRRVFTDGRNIFSSLSHPESAPDVVKWDTDEIDQVIAGAVFEKFLEEIEFDDSTALAHRWWPLGKSTPIVLDPRVSFGAPVVERTGVRTSTLALLAAASSDRDAADAYQLDLRFVQAAVAFELQLRAA